MIVACIAALFVAWVLLGTFVCALNHMAHRTPTPRRRHLRLLRDTPVSHKEPAQTR